MIDATRAPFDIIKRGIIPTDMEFYVVEFDEEMAREVLLHNREPETGKESTNRKASKVRVAEYADTMDDDEWLLSPQPLVFEEVNDAGETEYVDGQQRLKAFVEVCRRRPGFTQVFTVCINAPSRTKMVLDRGKGRTLVDFLRMSGHKNSVILGPALKLLYCYMQEPFVSISQWQGIKLTPQAQEAFLAEHPNLRYAIDRVRATPTQGMPQAVSVLYYLLHCEYGVEKADAFLEGISKGLVPGATTEDSRWRMREFLGAQHRAKYPWNGFEQLGMFILAANDWLKGWDAFIPAKHLRSLVMTSKFPRLFGKDD